MELKMIRTIVLSVFAICMLIFVFLGISCHKGEVHCLKNGWVTPEGILIKGDKELKESYENGINAINYELPYYEGGKYLLVKFRTGKYELKINEMNLINRNQSDSKAQKIDIFQLPSDGTEKILTISFINGLTFEELSSATILIGELDDVLAAYLQDHITPRPTPSYCITPEWM